MMLQSCMVLTFFHMSHLNVNFWNYTCNYSLTLLVEYFILTLKVTLIENETFNSVINDWKRVYKLCKRLFNEAFKQTKFQLGLFYSCTVTSIDLFVCLFVCLFVFRPIREFSLIWRCHYCWWRVIICIKGYDI